MCYMKRNEVGIRELRQNLSKYLRRVEEGKTLRVLDRGRPVAVLAPLPPPNESVLDRLIREGKAIPARADPSSLPPPLPAVATGRMTLSEALQEQRADRILDLRKK
jgi:prevent-host-death family protein